MSLLVGWPTRTPHKRVSICRPTSSARSRSSSTACRDGRGRGYVVRGGALSFERPMEGRNGSASCGGRPSSSASRAPTARTTKSTSPTNATGRRSSRRSCGSNPYKDVTPGRRPERRRKAARPSSLELPRLEPPAPVPADLARTVHSGLVPSSSTSCSGIIARAARDESVAEEVPRGLAGKCPRASPCRASTCRRPDGRDGLEAMRVVGRPLERPEDHDHAGEAELVAELVDVGRDHAEVSAITGSSPS